ncbi:right-handed parallel beta-helix repeat-containing protein [Candidatus Woesearchaeota archaeon]|nr:right-handed parallel beta-helix repeat-containing protein [Candidatus Woesearchaeota archaeon]
MKKKVRFEDLLSEAAKDIDVLRIGIVERGIIKKGDYLLKSDLITTSSTLVKIEPGVHLSVEPGVKLEFKGPVIAQGTKDDRIVISSSGKYQSLADTVNGITNPLSDYKLRAGRFEGVKFFDESFLEYCTIHGSLGISFENTKVNIKNCDIRENLFFWAGMALKKTSGVISNNVFCNNVGYRGGGMFCSYDSDIEIIDNKFMHNHSQIGAGIFVYRCNPVIRGNDFTHNCYHAIALKQPGFPLSEDGNFPGVPDVKKLLDENKYFMNSSDDVHVIR